MLGIWRREPDSGATLVVRRLAAGGLRVRSRRIARDLATFAVIGQAWPKVSVVVPALNEARNLPHVFAKLPDG